MKIKLQSDLHLEFYKNPNRTPYPKIEFTGEDVLVLAGDIQMGFDKPSVNDWFIHLLKYRPVIYCLGNHEYYQNFYQYSKNSGFPVWAAAINELATQKGYQYKLHLLDDSTIVLKDTMFVGGTLWTNMNDHDKNAIEKASFVMNDYRVIKNFTPEQSLESYEITKNLIEKTLNSQEYQSLKKVVVTHHLPSEKAVSPRWKNHSSNCYYYSNLDYLVEKADVWLFGHTHDSCDIMIGDCRVVCNPYGYRNYEENPDFQTNFLIEI
jgi:predicted phosphodiesterase